MSAADIEQKVLEFEDRPELERLYQQKYSAPRVDACRVYGEYAKLMGIKVAMGDSAGEKFSPGGEVDEMWHEHILWTPSYKKLTRQALGGVFLDHDPRKAHDNAEEREQRRENTRQAYELCYGTECAWFESDDVSYDESLTDSWSEDQSDALAHALANGGDASDTENPKKKAKVDDEIPIIVEKLTGEKFPVYARLGATVRELKQNVAAAESIRYYFD